MATTVLPQKRVFGETSSARRNIPSSPASAKKRKLEGLISSPAARFKSSQHGPKGKPGSSQPSTFESEVLEKMTQDMSTLKKNNSEKDQQWERPSLDDFNAQNDALIFQQIEAEEGTLPGGKTAVKLFGVTEVRSILLITCVSLVLTPYRPVIQLCCMLPTFFITSIFLPRCRLYRETAKVLRSI